MPAAAAKDPVAIGPVVQIIGRFVTLLGFVMLVPAAIDWVDKNPDWRVFLASAGVTLFMGIAMVLSTQAKIAQVNLRQGFLLTAGSWIVVNLFAALPFAFSDLKLSYADAFFEAMSGLTTTGSTVIAGLDVAPRGILLWRGLLQGIGGVGIIVVAVAILPFLRVGGMSLFRLESSDTSEKAVPQVKQLSAAIIQSYLVLAAIGTAALTVAGMTPFEAVVHTLAALSTGGFSTSDASLGHFQSPGIHWIITVLMVLGGLPFALYVRMAQGQMGVVIRDSQVLSFLRFLAIVTAVMALWLWWKGGRGVEEAIRHAAFNVVSIVTTTGFATEDYSLWGTLPVALFFMLTFVGGCTGSTAGAIKIFRFQVLAIAFRQYVWRRIYPHGVRAATYAGRPASEDVIVGVLIFIAVYLMTVAAASVALAAMGLDLVTSITGAATAVGNVGPGLGDIIGPAGNFSTLPEGAKWVLSFAMLLGRLELFTVLVLLVPSFWRG